MLCLGFYKLNKIAAAITTYHGIDVPPSKQVTVLLELFVRSSNARIHKYYGIYIVV